jgi:hypothetical protein
LLLLLLQERKKKGLVGGLGLLSAVNVLILRILPEAEEEKKRKKNC